MKRQNSLVLLASVMLVAMNFASCKSSNKPAADASAQDSIHRNDYSFFFNNLKQNVADRIKAYMEKQ